ncbi:pyrroline-5-carboxylate reductase-like [Prunus avium]|uniref:Pyrroline-5-carboxylate reductase-like n=1 Tax=Prunus avium TaxID=42229 RepID=A0A6P5RK43_PRUAV|nr:pyrroline-5-carboxylate reductase-like [Prunus avium]
MPNTPSAVGEAASVMSLGVGATEQDGDLIAKLFGSVGKTWKADEKLFDAVTGVSGSGPAYIYLAIEALADGGVAAGLPRELALGLASQTVSLLILHGVLLLNQSCDIITPSCICVYLSQIVTM